MLLAEEQQKRLQQLELKQRQLKEEINLLALPGKSYFRTNSKGTAGSGRTKNRYLTSKTMLESRIYHLQELIAQNQQQMTELSQEIADAKENEKRKEKIMQELGKKKELLQQKAEIDELYEKTSSLMIKNNTLLVPIQGAAGEYFKVRKLPHLPAICSPGTQTPDCFPGRCPGDQSAAAPRRIG